MKKTWLVLIVLLTGLLFASLAPARAKSKVIDMDFARELALKAIEGESAEWEHIDNLIATMKPNDLKTLQKLLLEITEQSPPITTSITGKWLIYSIIYTIDDKLGTLKYTKIVEGTFDWDRASSLVGTAILDFITDTGQKLCILTTVATVDKSSAYLEAGDRRVRLYINEEAMHDGTNRNNVVKIEPLY